jgi:hypothetical protein
VFLLALAVTLAGALGGCDRADDRPAAWGYISPAILQPNCATPSCHSPATAVSGLDFSTPDRGYTSLTQLWVWVVQTPDASAPLASESCGTVAGLYVCEEKVRRLVTPFDPDGSRLVNMLRARGAPRMPPDRPLAEADIRLIERWILNGACRTGLSCAGDGSVVNLDAARADAGSTGDAANGAPGDGASDLVVDGNGADQGGGG